MTSQRFCLACGAELTGGRFCAACGAAVGATTAPGQTPPPPRRTARKRSNLLPVLGGLAVAGIVVAGIAVGVLGGGDDQRNRASPNATTQTGGGSSGVSANGIIDLAKIVPGGMPPLPAGAEGFYSMGPNQPASGALQGALRKQGLDLTGITPLIYKSGPDQSLMIFNIDAAGASRITEAQLMILTRAADIAVVKQTKVTQVTFVVRQGAEDVIITLPLSDLAALGARGAAANAALSRLQYQIKRAAP